MPISEALNWGVGISIVFLAIALLIDFEDKREKERDKKREEDAR